MLQFDEVLKKHDESDLENEIAELESQLAKAKHRLNTKRRAASSQATSVTANGTDITSLQNTPSTSSRTTPVPRSPIASLSTITAKTTTSSSSPSTITPTPTPTPATDSAHHYLLLLSDSALPLGSFAFSSGLESYLAHARSPSPSPSSSASISQPTFLYKPSFASFLPLSLSSYASTTLPFALAAHRDPTAIADLDDALDAAVICAVGRRASTAQGRALLAIWEKSFAMDPPSPPLRSVKNEYDEESAARKALREYSVMLKRGSGTTSSSSSSSFSARRADGNLARDGDGNGEQEEEEAEDLPQPVSAHLAPLFGAVARVLGLTRRQTAYVFLLGHAKALVSAAVRAGMFGPYQAQRVLAGVGLQVLISDLVRREWDVDVGEAAQSVPVMDLWVGRHEMLYSRIFNS